MSSSFYFSGKPCNNHKPLSHSEPPKETAHNLHVALPGSALFYKFKSPNKPTDFVCMSCKAKNTLKVYIINQPIR